MAVTARTAAGQALAAATDALAAAGVATPRLDAEVMLAAASGVERARLLADRDLQIDGPAARRFGEMVRRRLEREPVAYIVGEKGFRRLALACDRRALVPRPETELLVDVAIELRPRSVLDVGTGSGAVALAIADELPRASIAATDVSEPALELARLNAERLGLSDRVTFSRGTLAPGAFDLVVANLPYVSESELEDLEPEIVAFEPRLALVAGADGLAVIRTLLAEVDPVVHKVLALEVGIGQSGDVAALLGAAGYRSAEVRRDLARVERVVIGTR